MKLSFLPYYMILVKFVQRSRKNYVMLSIISMLKKKYLN